MSRTDLGGPFDAAHDFLEGVIPYILSELVKNFFESSYFSLVDFYDVIENFDYARVDKNDVPQPFSINTGLNNFQVKLTAAECWVFIRLFPLMFGHLVAQGDEYWDILLILLDYFELLMSFEFHPGTTYTMDNILEHLYKKISDKLLELRSKPKFHFALHYGLQTRLYGPPRIRFTLRYESKHLAIKQPLNLSKNRKNICLTLANRHQSQLYLRYRDESFLSAQLHSPVGLCEEHIKALRYDVQQLLQPMIGDTDIIYMSYGIKLPDGSFYENDIVLNSEDGKNYVFLKINKIAFYQGEPYVICEECDTVSYSMHYHAYQINPTSKYILIELKCLKTNHVLGMYDINNKIYVPLKFSVLNVL